MVSLTVIFWMFVILFAIIGAMRGWAKELMVSFSVILAMFIIVLMETYAPPFKDDAGLGASTRFWVRFTIVLLAVFFGYQTPNIRALAGARFVRERLQDVLLGFILGGINGYLVVGTIWFYMHEAGYPFQDYFTAPDGATDLGKAALELLENMPPTFLDPPLIYFAVAIAFLFVVVVFI
ncbi:MAG TPA: CvpA family protein [Anaerolineales bacterium]